MAERYESKDHTTTREDAPDGDAARKRRRARLDSEHKFSITKERTDVGFKLGVGLFAGEPAPDTTEPDGDAAKARRDARLRGGK